MSGTLYARRKPKSKYPWHFKMTIRDKINSRFPNGTITPADLPYIEGLRDAADDGDAHTLGLMSVALEEGDEIEFKVEY